MAPAEDRSGFATADGPDGLRRAAKDRNSDHFVMIYEAGQQGVDSRVQVVQDETC